MARQRARMSLPAAHDHIAIRALTPRRRPPAVAGDDIAAAVDQNRDVEAESFDAPRDLPDLFLAVPAGVPGIWPHAVQRQIGDGEGRAGARLERVFEFGVTSNPPDR